MNDRFRQARQLRDVYAEALFGASRFDRCRYSTFPAFFADRQMKVTDARQIICAISQFMIMRGEERLGRRAAD